MAIQRTIKYGNWYPHDFSPKKAGDVGHDLYAHIDREHMNLLERMLSRLFFKGRGLKVVWPVIGQVLLHSGLQILLPTDVWAEIRARSSTSRRKLQILGGTIDSGYTGEYLTVIHNFGLKPRLLFSDERYAQVVFYPRLTTVTKPIPVHEWVPEAGRRERGSTGFGSTGR